MYNNLIPALVFPQHSLYLLLSAQRNTRTQVKYIRNGVYNYTFGNLILLGLHSSQCRPAGMGQSLLRVSLEKKSQVQLVHNHRV